jgi:hypothetical protein
LRNLSRMCSAVLLSTRISLTKFEAVSMQVNALDSTCQPLTLTFHGPIKSLATSSQGAIRTSHLGRRRYPRPANLCAFGNLCTSIYQCDSAIWGDNNVDLTSLVIFFHQDNPLLGGTI